MHSGIKTHSYCLLWDFSGVNYRTLQFERFAWLTLVCSPISKRKNENHTSLQYYFFWNSLRNCPRLQPVSPARVEVSQHRPPCWFCAALLWMCQQVFKHWHQFFSVCTARSRLRSRTPRARPLVSVRQPIRTGDTSPFTTLYVLVDRRKPWFTVSICDRDKSLSSEISRDIFAIAARLRRG